MLALNADPVTLHWGFQKGSAILLGESHVDPTTLRGTYFQSVRPTLISPYKRVSVRKTVFLALPIPKRFSLWLDEDPKIFICFAKHASQQSREHVNRVKYTTFVWFSRQLYITRRLVTVALLVVLFRALILLMAKRSGFLLLCIHFRSSSKYWRVFSLVPLKFHLLVITGHLYFIFWNLLFYNP